MRQKSQTRGSLTACLRPCHVEPFSSVSTRSRNSRSWASVRSSGVSHRVVRGVSGRNGKARIATRPVAAPFSSSALVHF